MAAAVSGKDGKSCCVGTNAKCEKKQSAEMEGFEMRPSDSYLAAHDEAGDPQRLDCAHRGGISVDGNYLNLAGSSEKKKKKKKKKKKN